MNKLVVSSPHPFSGIRLLKKQKIPNSYIQQEYLQTLIETQIFHHEFWTFQNSEFKSTNLSDSEFLKSCKKRHSLYYKDWMILNFKLLYLGYLDFFSEIRYSYKPLKFIGFRTQGITVR